VPFPSIDTAVTYPDGETVSTGTVLHTETLADGRTAVVLDRTAFHPIDTAWPDQPADRGVLRSGPGEQAIVDGVVGGIHEGEVVFGSELRVRTGTEGWTFVVAHVIDGAPAAGGAQGEVVADAEYRRAHTGGHTASHLASRAQDAALAEAWTKETPLDAHGSPAFDALAIQTSRIIPNGSLDVYRIGKSLRRKGFDPTALDDPAGIADRANAHLARWVAAGGAVRIERQAEGLSARRTWVCELGDDRVEIPCGGTHVTSLAELASVTVSLAATPVEGGIELTMTTTAEPEI
jgi:alanyl-tRNA synthetase